VLFALEQAVRDGFRPTVAKTRAQNEQSLHEMGLITDEERTQLPTRLAEQLAREEARRRSRPSAFSVQQRRQPSLQEVIASDGLWATLTSIAWQSLGNAALRQRIAVASVGLCSLLLAWAIWDTGAATPRPSGTGPVLAVPMTVTGRVQGLLNDKRMVCLVTTTGLEITVTGNTSYSHIAVGDEVVAEVVPFRLEGNQSVVAMARSLHRR